MQSEQKKHSDEDGVTLGPSRVEEEATGQAAEGGMAAMWPALLMFGLLIAIVVWEALRGG